MKRLVSYLLILALLVCVYVSYADHSTLRQDSFNTIPDSQTSTFRTDSRIFWDHEDAQREGRYLSPFVYTGGSHPTSATLTSTAFATEAFVPERISQVAAAITYPASANDVCITIISSDNDGIVGWTRVDTTAYYVKCQGSTTPNYNPTIPANSTQLMEVTVTSSTLNAVADIRRLTPVNFLNTLGIASLKDYGCKGNGTNDDSLCWNIAIAAGKTLIIPEGTYYLPTAATQTGGTVTLWGAGAGKTFLLAKAATVPSCVTAGNSNLFSYSILKITSATQVTIRDLTLDGNRTSGPYCNNGNYADQHSLVEIITSSNVSFERVQTTRFAGSEAVVSAGGTINPAGFLKSANFGPVWIDQSSNVTIFQCQSRSPSFNEGWILTESNHVTVDTFFSDAGSIDHVQYGQSSPIAILGISASAYDVKVINSTFKNNNGSVGIYVDHTVRVANNYFNNGTGLIMWDSLFSPLIAPPTGVLPGDIPILDNVVIEGNEFYDIPAYCISIGKSQTPGTIRASNVIIANNICRRAGGGFITGDTYGLHITNNRAYEVTEQVSGYIAADVSNSDSTNVSIADNTFDGSVALTNGSGRCTNGVVPGCKTLRNIEVTNCQTCSITNNLLSDASSNNIYVSAATDNIYGTMTVTGNNIKNNVVIPSTPITIGVDITHRLKDAYVKDNTINSSMQTALGSGGNTAVFAVNPLADLNTVQAYLGTNSAGLTTTPAIVVWNHADYDSWKVSSNVAILNTTTGVFTIPPNRRGFQVIEGAVTVASLANGKSAICTLYVGGVSKKFLNSYGNGTGGVSSPTIPITAKIWMNGDATPPDNTFDIRCSSDDAANPVITGTADKTYMTVQFSGSF